MMKGVYDLIRQSDESVYVIDRLTQVVMQQADRRGKRSAVSLGELAAAGLAGRMKEFDHVLNITIN